MKCSKCGSEIREGAKFCGECGEHIKQEAVCVNCGEKLVEGQKFCSYCGKAVEGIEVAEVSPKKKGKKETTQEHEKSKFKSNVVMKALREIPGTVLNEKAVEDIAKIISVHALGAATSSAAAAWIPGAGATLAAVGYLAFIWTMYIRINERMGLNMSKKKMKFLSSAVLSYLANFAGTWLLGTAVSFIPGVGSMVSTVLMAGASYAMVTASGVVYLNLMSSLADSGEDISNLSEEELKKKMDDVVKNSDLKSIMKEAKNEYVKARKDGTVSGKETVDLEEE